MDSGSRLSKVKELQNKEVVETTSKGRVTTGVPSKIWTSAKLLKPVCRSANLAKTLA